MIATVEAKVGEAEPGNDPVAERDFYRRLLDLGEADEPDPLVEQALVTIVAASGAQAAYLELRGLDDGEATPALWRAHGCSADDVASIRASISRGIIARALSDGRTITTPSAVADPSFRDQPSVLRNAIQAVICAPIGRPAIGVLYLQAPASSAHFAARNQAAVELFARQLATVASRLLARRHGATPADATAEIRKHFRCDGLVGRSAALAAALREAAQVTPLPITVLLTGPVGTGKSAMARAIAANSPRATAPYIDLNCAAIPEHLMEGELFGAEAGAYTGATRKMLGKVAAARGGTLFLDEVAELSLPAQAKLLQLLQERRYYPLGATAPVVADVRIISATNADLKARVAEKRFREDLYYRLAIMTITLPGLEQRRDDIPDLVTHFCADACRRNQVSDLPPTRRTLAACREAPWPGNVRELGNAIEAAVVRASYEGASVVDEHHVFPAAPRGDGAPLTFREATQRAQRRHLEEALTRNEWNITRTAVELDLNRQHLHELVHAYGLRRPQR